MLLDIVTDYLDFMRADLTDQRLLERYKVIFKLMELGYDKEQSLVNYVNELEFRGLKYKSYKYIRR